MGDRTGGLMPAGSRHHHHHHRLPRDIRYGSASQPPTEPTETIESSHISSQLERRSERERGRKETPSIQRARQTIV